MYHKGENNMHVQRFEHDSDELLKQVYEASFSHCLVD